MMFTVNGARVVKRTGQNISKICYDLKYVGQIVSKIGEGMKRAVSLSRAVYSSVEKSAEAVNDAFAEMLEPIPYFVRAPAWMAVVLGSFSSFTYYVNPPRNIDEVGMRENFGIVDSSSESEIIISTGNGSSGGLEEMIKKD